MILYIDLYLNFQTQRNPTGCEVSSEAATTVSTWGQIWGTWAGGGTDLVSGSDLPWTVSVRKGIRRRTRYIVIRDR